MAEEYGFKIMSARSTDELENQYKAFMKDNLIKAWQYQTSVMTSNPGTSSILYTVAVCFKPKEIEIIKGIEDGEVQFAKTVEIGKGEPVWFMCPKCKKSCLPFEYVKCGNKLCSYVFTNEDKAKAKSDYEKKKK